MGGRCSSCTFRTQSRDLASRSLSVAIDNGIAEGLMRRSSHDEVRNHHSCFDAALSYGQIVVTGGATCLDSLLDCYVVIAFWENGDHGMAATLAFVVWMPNVVVWAFLRAHGLSTSWELLLALTGLTPIFELVSSLCNGEPTKGMTWFTIGEGVIEAPLSVILTFYGILIGSIPVQWYTAGSLAWSLATVSRTLKKLDFFGQSPDTCSSGVRFLHRFIEAGWRLLSLGVLAALLRWPDADAHLMAQFMIFPILLVEFAVNFELLGLSARKLKFAVRLFVSAVMVTGSPPLLIPSAGDMTPSYVRLRAVTTILAGAMIIFCSQWEAFASQGLSLLTQWPVAIAIVGVFGALQLVSILTRFDWRQWSMGNCELDLGRRLDLLNGALVEAIENRDVILVGVLVAEGADFNCMDSSGFRAVHHIISHFNVDVAQFALEHDACFTDVASDGDTALCLAARRKDKPAVKWLLESIDDAFKDFPVLRRWTGLHEHSLAAGGLHNGGHKYSGIALGVDGKLYCSPYNAGAVLVIDTASNTLSLLHTDGLETGGGKYIGIASGGDGKLYCAPFNAAAVLVVDPVAQSLELLHDERLGGRGSKYCGIAAGAKGKLYCSPFNADDLLVIDPSTSTASCHTHTHTQRHMGRPSTPASPRRASLSFLPDARLKDGSDKYSSIAQGPDGHMYCTPRDAVDILVVDSNTDVISFIPTGFTANGDKYHGIAQGSDGKLYCAPFNASAVMVIDPTLRSCHFLKDERLQAGGTKYVSIALGSDGKLYCAPADAKDVLVVDPANDGQLSFLPVGGAAQPAKYWAIAEGSNGKMYCAPRHAPDLLIVDPAKSALVQELQGVMDFDRVADRLVECPATA